MNQKYYHTILRHHAILAGLHLIGQNFVFQEDNDPKHSAAYCRNYLSKKEKEGSKTIILVAYWLAMKQAWESITVVELKKYINTMPARL